MKQQLLKKIEEKSITVGVVGFRLRRITACGRKSESRI